jgi:hypothetical protein
MVMTRTQPPSDCPRRDAGDHGHILVEMVVDDPVDGKLWRLDGAAASAASRPGAASPAAVPFAGWVGLCAAMDGALHPERTEDRGPAAGAR